MLDAGNDEVAFFVNGEKVHKLARSGLKLDGIVDLRVNDDVNIHVSELTVEGK